jgi:hypothetical protein
MNCRFLERLTLRNAEARWIDLSGSHVPGLDADQLRTSGNVVFAREFRSDGEVSLVRAVIGGDLDFRGGTFEAPGGHALRAEGAQVAGAVLLADGFHANGLVTFVRARLGEFAATASTIVGSSHGALLLDAANINGRAWLAHGLRTTGEVRLIEARIGGALDLSDAFFESPKGYALSCDRIEVGDNLYLRRVRTKGAVRLHGAKVGGDISCTGAKLSNSGGHALTLDGAQVAGGIFLSEGFSTEGAVRINSATIGGSLFCIDCSINHQGGFAFICESSQIGVTLFFRRASVQTGISLGATVVGNLSDDAESWAAPLMLDGFRYDRIVAGPTSAQKRANWLRLQRAELAGLLFWPQPWDHAAKVLREMGHADEATKLSIAKQRELRKKGVIGGRPTSDVAWPARLKNLAANTAERRVHALYGAVAGYGYRKFQATSIAVMIVWLASGFAYRSGQDLMGPTNPLVFQRGQEWSCGVADGERRESWIRCPSLPPEHTTFDPFMYSADLILPFVNLQQDQDWAPIVTNSTGKPVAAGQRLRILMWLEILFGWGAVGYLVTLVTSAVGRPRAP